jgi:hypothetical protein
MYDEKKLILDGFRICLFFNDEVVTLFLRRARAIYFFRVLTVIPAIYLPSFPQHPHRHSREGGNLISVYHFLSKSLSSQNGNIKHFYTRAICC